MVHSDGYGRTQGRLFPAQDHQNTARRELRQLFFSAEIEAVFASMEQFQIGFCNLIPHIALPNSICGTLAASPTGIQHLFSSRRLDPGEGSPCTGSLNANSGSRDLHVCLENVHYVCGIFP